jgi:hypothetical protein
MKDLTTFLDALLGFSIMGSGVLLVLFAVTHGSEQGSLQVLALGIGLLGIGNLVSRSRP